VLLHEEPDVPGFVVRYREEIADAAARYDLPEELVAAVIVNHQDKISARDRFTDCAGSALGYNVSVGLAQLRLSTAARLDDKEIAALSAPEFRSLRSRLLEPALNIAYEARELRALLERQHRYPGIGASELIHEPAVMALLITEYRVGRRGTPNDSTRLSGAAFDALRWILRGDVDYFGRDATETMRIQEEVRAYLHYIHCESGIFNASGCESWKRSQAVDRSTG
jgi:hypothetical protein